MNNSYTKDGINIETYKLLFKEQEQGKKECSSEILTVDLSSLYNKKIYFLLYNLIKKLGSYQ